MNNIVRNCSIEEIVKSVRTTIDYIRYGNTLAQIIFLACLHVNGKLDRNNNRINTLNTALKLNF